MTAPEPLRVGLPPEARIHFAITECIRRADELAEAGDVSALGVLLGKLRGLGRQFKDVERHVEDHTAALMPYKRMELDGRVLEKHSGSRWSNWQSPELLRHLVGDQLVDTRTGEDVYPLLVAVLRPEWRVTALREHGIDPEDWADRTEGRATVRIVEPDHD